MVDDDWTTNPFDVAFTRLAKKCVILTSNAVLISQLREQNLLTGVDALHKKNLT